MKQHNLWVWIVLISILEAGCAKVSNDVDDDVDTIDLSGGQVEEETTTVSPMDTYVAPSNPADYRLQSVSGGGQLISATPSASANWWDGYTWWSSTSSTDGWASGAYSFASGVVTYERGDLSSCTDVLSPYDGDNGNHGTAPNCKAAWWSATNAGMYVGQSPVFLPPADSLYQKWGDLREVSLDITQTLITHNLSSNSGELDFAECGIAFGFGAKTPHAQATQTLVDLNIPGVTRPLQGQDYIRIGYRTRFSDGTDVLVADARVNGVTGNGNYDTGANGAGWSLFWRDANFNVTSGGQLMTRGDYFKYRMKVVHDPSAYTLTFTITPIATNKTLGAFSEASYTWHYDHDYNAQAGGEADGGIIFGDSGAAGEGDAASGQGDSHMPLKADFADVGVAIGFTSNGATKRCQYENLSITTAD